MHLTSRLSPLLIRNYSTLLFRESSSHLLIRDSCSSIVWDSPPCPPFAIESWSDCDGCCDSIPRSPCCKSVFSSPSLRPTLSPSLFQVYSPISLLRLDLSVSVLRFDLLSLFCDSPHITIFAIWSHRDLLTLDWILKTNRGGMEHAQVVEREGWRWV